MEWVRFVSPGEPVVLSFDSGSSGGVLARITSRTVHVARESPLQKFIYNPSIWGSTVAGLAVLMLLSTAFATGTIRPAPPPAPTPAPGEPTPTPDTRPAISIGGFQLVAPAPVATPNAATSLSVTVGGVQTVQTQPDSTSTDEVAPASPTCTN